MDRYAEPGESHRVRPLAPTDAIDDDPTRLSRLHRRTIEGAFPGVRFVEDCAGVFDEVFECPPGVEVTLPGEGCRILDDGVLVVLGELRASGSGEAEIHAMLAESTRHGSTTGTWARTFRIRIAESETGFEVAEIVRVSVT